MFFLNLPKTFTLGHKKQLSSFPHSYFMGVRKILINVHNYKNKDAGLNRSENKHRDCQWASCPRGRSRRASAKRPCLAHGPTAPAGPRVEVAARLKVWSLTELHTLLTCTPDYFYKRTYTWLRGHLSQCFWQWNWGGTIIMKNGSVLQNDDCFYSQMNVHDFLLCFKEIFRELIPFLVCCIKHTQLSTTLSHN